jgi:hypothetical protein
MTILTNVKDYIEVVHKLLDTSPSAINETLTYTNIILIFSYTISFIKQLFFSLLHFDFLKTFFYLPISIPNIASSMISEISILDEKLTNMFSFLDTPYTNTTLFSDFVFLFLSKFITGFLNSLFLWLPTCATTFLCFRRFAMQGIEVGYASALGTLCANIIWLFCILFGFRFAVIPWIHLDVIRYCLGFLLLAKYFWDNRLPSQEIRSASNLNQLALQKIFLFHLLLAFTEQSSFYGFLNQFSFNAQSTLLETSTANNLTQFLILQTSYLLGIFTGSFSLIHLMCWFWEQPISNFYSWFQKTFKQIRLSDVVKRIHFLLQSITFTFACASLPYLGVEYALMKPLGFVPNDKLVHQFQLTEAFTHSTSPLSYSNQKYLDKSLLNHLMMKEWSEAYKNKNMPKDTSLYDQGAYRIFTMEDLHYGSDYDWIRRRIPNTKIRGRIKPTRMIPKKWVEKIVELKKDWSSKNIGRKIDMSNQYQMSWNSSAASSFNKLVKENPFIGGQNKQWQSDVYWGTKFITSSQGFFWHWWSHRNVTDNHVWWKWLNTLTNKTGNSINANISTEASKPNSSVFPLNTTRIDQLKTFKEKSLGADFWKPEQRLLFSYSNSYQDFLAKTKKNMLFSDSQQFQKQLSVVRKLNRKAFYRFNQKKASFWPNQTFSLDHLNPHFLLNPQQKFTTQIESKTMNNYNTKNSKTNKAYEKKSLIQKVVAHNSFIPSLVPYKKEQILQILKLHNSPSFSWNSFIKKSKQAKKTSWNLSIWQNNNTIENGMLFVNNAEKMKTASVDQQILFYKDALIQNDLMQNFSKPSKKVYHLAKHNDLIEKTQFLNNFKKQKQNHLKIQNFSLIEQKTSLNHTTAFSHSYDSKQNHHNMQSIFSNGLLLHPLEFYLQKEEAFSRKLSFYGVQSSKKLQKANNAAIFQFYLKTYFQDLKPTRLAARKTNMDKFIFSNTARNRNKQKMYMNKKAVKNQIMTNTPWIRQWMSQQGFLVRRKRLENWIGQLHYDPNELWAILMKFDIDHFMQRQPKAHYLNSMEEKLLHARRILLYEHYNSLRWYKHMQHYGSMKTKIGTTKSFSSQPYNQQFKGTFHKVRHLFALTPSASAGSVLTYDQPLYNEYENHSNASFLRSSLIHEELLSSTDVLKKNLSEKTDQIEQTFFNEKSQSSLHMKKIQPDLVNQASDVVKQYVMASTDLRGLLLTDLIKHKKELPLTHFLWMGQKTRGQRSATGYKTWLAQEKQYLLNAENQSDLNKWQSNKIQKLVLQKLQTDNLSLKLFQKRYQWSIDYNKATERMFQKWKKKLVFQDLSNWSDIGRSLPKRVSVLQPDVKKVTDMNSLLISNQMVPLLTLLPLLPEAQKQGQGQKQDNMITTRFLGKKKDFFVNPVLTKAMKDAIKTYERNDAKSLFNANYFDKNNQLITINSAKQDFNQLSTEQFLKKMNVQQTNDILNKTSVQLDLKNHQNKIKIMKTMILQKIKQKKTNAFVSILFNSKKEKNQILTTKHPNSIKTKINFFLSSYKFIKPDAFFKTSAQTENQNFMLINNFQSYLLYKKNYQLRLNLTFNKRLLTTKQARAQKISQYVYIKDLGLRNIRHSKRQFNTLNQPKKGALRIILVKPLFVKYVKNPSRYNQNTMLSLANQITQSNLHTLTPMQQFKTILKQIKSIKPIDKNQSTKMTNNDFSFLKFFTKPENITEPLMKKKHVFDFFSTPQSFLNSSNAFTKKIKNMLLLKTNKNDILNRQMYFQNRLPLKLLQRFDRSQKHQMKQVTASLRKLKKRLLQKVKKKLKNQINQPDLSNRTFLRLPPLQSNKKMKVKYPFLYDFLNSKKTPDSKINIEKSELVEHALIRPLWQVIYDDQEPPELLHWWNKPTYLKNIKAASGKKEKIETKRRALATKNMSQTQKNQFLLKLPLKVKKSIELPSNVDTIKTRLILNQWLLNKTYANENLQKKQSLMKMLIDLNKPQYFKLSQHDASDFLDAAKTELKKSVKKKRVIENMISQKKELFKKITHHNQKSRYRLLGKRQREHRFFNARDVSQNLRQNLIKRTTKQMKSFYEKKTNLNKWKDLSYKTEKENFKKTNDQWWKKKVYLNQASNIKALLQIEIDSQIEKSLNKLSIIQILQNNHFNTSSKDLQIGNQDFKPLALPQAIVLWKQQKLKNILTLQTTTQSAGLAESNKASTILAKQNQSDSKKNAEQTACADFMISDVYTSVIDSFKNQNFKPDLSKQSTNDCFLSKKSQPFKENSLMTASPFLMSDKTFHKLYVSTNNLPFYAGWDENLRKFVITNRLLSRQSAGFESFSEKPKVLKSMMQQKPSLNNKNTNILSFNPVSKQKALDKEDETSNDIQNQLFSLWPQKGQNSAITFFSQFPFILPPGLKTFEVLKYNKVLPISFLPPTTAKNEDSKTKEKTKENILLKNLKTSKKNFFKKQKDNKINSSGKMLTNLRLPEQRKAYEQALFSPLQWRTKKETTKRVFVQRQKLILNMLQSNANAQRLVFHSSLSDQLDRKKVTNIEKIKKSSTIHQFQRQPSLTWKTKILRILRKGNKAQQPIPRLLYLKKAENRIAFIWNKNKKTRQAVASLPHKQSWYRREQKNAVIFLSTWTKNKNPNVLYNLGEKLGLQKKQWRMIKNKRSKPQRKKPNPQTTYLRPRKKNLARRSLAVVYKNPLINKQSFNSTTFDLKDVKKTSLSDLNALSEKHEPIAFHQWKKFKSKKTPLVFDHPYGQMFSPSPLQTPNLYDVLPGHSRFMPSSKITPFPQSFVLNIRQAMKLVTRSPQKSTKTQIHKTNQAYGWALQQLIENMSNKINLQIQKSSTKEKSQTNLAKLHLLHKHLHLIKKRKKNHDQFFSGMRHLQRNSLKLKKIPYTLALTKKRDKKTSRYMDWFQYFYVEKKNVTKDLFANLTHLTNKITQSKNVADTNQSLFYKAATFQSQTQEKSFLKSKTAFLSARKFITEEPNYSIKETNEYMKTTKERLLSQKIAKNKKPFAFLSNDLKQTTMYKWTFFPKISEEKQSLLRKTMDFLNQQNKKNKDRIFQKNKTPDRLVLKSYGKSTFDENLRSSQDVNRHYPLNGGFVWPGDYLRLQTIKIPKTQKLLYLQNRMQKNKNLTNAASSMSENDQWILKTYLDEKTLYNMNDFHKKQSLLKQKNKMIQSSRLDKIHQRIKEFKMLVNHS